MSQYLQREVRQGRVTGIYMAGRRHDGTHPADIAGTGESSGRDTVVVFADEPSLIASIRRELPGVRVVTLPRDASSVDVLVAIERVIEPSSGVKRAPRINGETIAPRELDVLRRVAAGDTNAEAAEAMGLARNTVKAYLRSAMHKLAARNRIDAINRAREYDLI